MNSKVLLNKAQKKRSLLSMFLMVGLLAITLMLGYFFYKNQVKKSEIELSQSAVYGQLQQILDQSDVINTNWLRTLDPLIKKVKGRVVWSNTLQKGAMEFFGLPELGKMQSYQLWIYDLDSKSAKPIFVKEFTKVNQGNELLPFFVNRKIVSPFKFEILLKTEGEEVTQPLFLAQP